MKIGKILGLRDPRATMIYAQLQPGVGREELEGIAAEIHSLTDAASEGKIAGAIGARHRPALRATIDGHERSPD